MACPQLQSRLIFTCARNEGPFLLEWVAHHRAIGFSDILIFTNDCEDATDAIADRLSALGLARHVDNSGHGENGPQWSAMKSEALREALANAEWAAHLDIDEFLNIAAPGGLAGLIDTLTCDAMAIPWRFFGSGGQMAFNDAPVTAQFTATSSYPVSFPRQAMMFKSLFRPDRFAQPGIHAPRAKKGAQRHWVNGDGRPVGPHFSPERPLLAGPDAGSALAQINHYAVKSAESFLVKSARGLPNHRQVPIDLNYWVLRNPGTTTDKRLADRSEELQAEIATLREDTELERLHRAACDWHRAKAAGMMNTEDGVALYTGIAMVGASTTPDEPQIRRIYSAMQQVYGGGKR